MPKNMLRYTAEEVLEILRADAEKHVGHPVGEINLRVTVETVNEVQYPVFHGADIDHDPVPVPTDNNECAETSESDPA
jgi:hypothetical protein